MSTEWLLFSTKIVVVVALVVVVVVVVVVVDLYLNSVENLQLY